MFLDMCALLKPKRKSSPFLCYKYHAIATSSPRENKGPQTREHQVQVCRTLSLYTFLDSWVATAAIGRPRTRQPRPRFPCSASSNTGGGSTRGTTAGGTRLRARGRPGAVTTTGATTWPSQGSTSWPPPSSWGSTRAVSPSRSAML